MTLIVVTDTPVAWHDTEAFLEETKVGDEPLGMTSSFFSAPAVARKKS